MCLVIGLIGILIGIAYERYFNGPGGGASKDGDNNEYKIDEKGILGKVSG